MCIEIFCSLPVLSVCPPVNTVMSFVLDISSAHHYLFFVFIPEYRKLHRRLCFQATLQLVRAMWLVLANGLWVELTCVASSPKHSGGDMGFSCDLFLYCGKLHASIIRWWILRHLNSSEHLHRAGSLLTYIRQVISKKKILQVRPFYFWD